MLSLESQLTEIPSLVLWGAVNLNVSPDEVEENMEIRGKQNSLFTNRPVIK